MPCYKPLKAWYGRQVNPKTGKREIVFKRSSAFTDLPLEVPCGQCIGCRIQKSKEWAIRAHHEAQLHERNCFITLTYKPEKIPYPPTIAKEVFQKFIRKLRKEIKKYEPKTKIRYLACGEYGSLKNRPHYHAIIFGWDDPQKRLWSIANGNQIYRSPLIESVWKEGFSTVGSVTFQSAAYVARYVTKKTTGKNAEKEYRIFDKETGEILQLEPEFALMSNRPGIGAKWYAKYKQDTYKDYVTVDKKKYSIPEYYKRLMEKEEEERAKSLKIERVKQARRSKDNTPDRLRQREIVQKTKAKKLIRTFEE